MCSLRTFFLFLLLWTNWILNSYHHDILDPLDSQEHNFQYVTSISVSSYISEATFWMQEFFKKYLEHILATKAELQYNYSSFFS